MSKLTSFTAIDFETAQGKRWSICQVGLVRVEHGNITEKLSILVQPPENYYHYMNIKIHRITPSMTLTKPTFNKIWLSIKPYIQNQNLVAHNMAFDNSCLQQTLSYYKLPIPSYNQYCTYKIFGQGLSYVCKAKGVILGNHHDALADALACAKLFLLYLK
jgi:DNA polymerase-3 subunit epsilon